LTVLSLQRYLTNIGLLGLAMPSGALLYILGDQALRTTPAENQAWWILPATALLALAFMHKRRVPLQAPTGRAFVLALMLLALGSLLLQSLWRRNPIRTDGWISYFVDLSTHEALAQGIALNGPAQVPYLANVPLGYHWLGNAWAGGLSQSFDLTPYVAVSRGLYAYALVAALVLSWALGQQVSRNSWAGPGAALFLIGGTFLGLGRTYSYSMLLVDTSPSHTFAIPLTLMVSVLAIGYLHGRLPVHILLVFPLLGAGLLGSRVTQASIVLAGLGSVLVTAVALRRTDVIRRSTFVLATLILGMIPAFFLIIRPAGSATATTQLRVDPNNDIAGLYSLIPYTGPGDNVVSFFALAASVLAGAAGVLAFALRRPTRWIATGFVLGALVVGLVLVVVLSQNGRSQVSYLWAAAVVAFPIAGVGFVESVSRISQRCNRLVVTGLLCVGLTIGLIGVVNVEATSDLWFSGYLRWSLIIGAWGLALVIGFELSRSQEPHYARTASISAVIAVVLGSAVLGANAIGTTWRTISTTTSANSSTPAAISSDHLTAANWVRENLQDSDGIFATNRLCDVPTMQPPDCVSTTFVTSALTGRRTLIEGYSYGIQEMPAWAERRARESYGLTSGPDSNSLDYLRQQGVRWLWIDGLVGQAQDPSEYGRVVYQNPTIEIVDISPESP